MTRWKRGLAYGHHRRTNTEDGRGPASPRSPHGTEHDAGPLNSGSGSRYDGRTAAPLKFRVCARLPKGMLGNRFVNATWPSQGGKVILLVFTACS